MILQLLLSKECFAFIIQPTSIIVSSYYDYSKSDRVLRLKPLQIKRVSSDEPIDEHHRKKLVDQSKQHADSSPTMKLNKEVEEDLCYMDELTGRDVGQACFVSDSSTSISSDTHISPSMIDAALRYIPIIMPLLAYSTYESTAQLFDNAVTIISNNNWIAVDGGAYQAEIITPAINGLVVPSIALLFATLVANTINSLRLRQQQIRTSLNTEANDIRMLSTMIDSLPKELHEVKYRLRDYLIQYTSRIIAESRPGLSVDLQMLDCELNGFLGLWNKVSMASYQTMYIDTMLPVSNETINNSSLYQNDLNLSQRQLQSSTQILPSYIFTEAYDALTRLRSERSIRLSSLQSTYPPLHYVILTLLGSSICTTFLMETNQELLIFLSAIQLRILWSMLIGTFSALAVVNYDLRDPFRGSYNVDISVDQFYEIREAIRATISLEQSRR